MFFGTSEKQQECIRIACQWLGTPFHPYAKIRNVGVDCIHLCAEIYREAGLFDAYEFPRYVMDGGDHRNTSQITEWLGKHPHFLPVPQDRPEIGDVVCFKLGRVVHHAGIFLGEGRFIHAMRNYGVIESLLDDPTFKKRFAAVYRPV